jgi:hypothetical protein
MGRRPLRRENAKPLWRETLRSRAHLFVRADEGKRREGRFWERDLESIWSGGSAQEARSPREQELPTQANPLGARGRRLAGQVFKPLERRD